MEEKSLEQVSLNKTEHRLHFAQAVADAQYLVIYASTNCPNDINPVNIEKLAAMRKRMENGEEVTAQEEAEFWGNYQEFWNLVKPVTAESVKANLPTESTLAGKLFARLPSIAWWFGVSPTSKAGKAASWFSFQTVVILILLVILQAYWVVGNQLITQLATLLQQEAEINAQLVQTERDYSALEVLYKQGEIDTENYKATGEYSFYSSPDWERDILENTAKRRQLEKDLELLKTQLERNSSILLVWSKPWNWLIQNDLVSAEALIPVTGADAASSNLTTKDEYELRIASLRARIAAIDDYLASDPDGENEAQLLNSKYDPEIKNNEEQLGALYAENSGLYVREAEIQSQIDDIQSQLDAISSGESTIEQVTSDLTAQLTGLKTQKNTLEQKVNEISGQITTATAEAEADVSALQAQLAGLQTEQKTVLAQISKIENQLKAISGNTDTLKELNTELDVLNARKKFNNEQIQTIQVKNEKLLEQRIPGGQIVNQWREEKQRLEDDLRSLERQAQADARRESSRQAQLAGSFVLVVLQSYLLPLLYGILGASSYVLRTLSQQIKSVTFSEESRLQNPVRISLGALAGIMVAFLLPTDESTSFFGSISPLALAFLVGYNIEFFFAIMDFLLNRVKDFLEKSSSTTEPAAQDEASAPKPKTNKDEPLKE